MLTIIAYRNTIEITKSDNIENIIRIAKKHNLTVNETLYNIIIKNPTYEFIYNLASFYNLHIV